MSNNIKSLSELRLEIFQLKNEVISCEEAAVAKGIPLKNELKTLIIQTSNGLYAVHLPGDKQASLRAVKNFLHVEEAYLLEEEELKQLGLLPGTVSPFVEIVWNLPNLVSQDLMDLKFVSTNDGSRKGYIKFDPQILLRARDVKVGKFSKGQFRRR